MTWIKGVPPKMLHDQFGVYQGLWMPEMDRCWIRTEDGCCVCSRLIRTSMGNVEHVTISRRDPNNMDEIITTDGRGELTWAEKQQIKDELFGEKRTAVEFFPSKDRLIDAADVYHLWVFDKNYLPPFGIHPKEYKKAINRGYNMTEGELKILSDYYANRRGSKGTEPV